MSDLLLLISGAVLAIVASGFFSGSEMGVYALNDVRLRVEAGRGVKAARRLAAFVERLEVLVITALVGTNIADYLASVCVTAILLKTASHASAEVYATAILTPAILVFGNILPKERFRRWPERTMYAVSGPLVLFAHLVRFSGVSAVLTHVSQRVLRTIDPGRALAERDVLPRARMLQVLREGAERGGLTTLQREAMERVMQLSRLRVARVMIPLQRAATIPESISRDDLLRIARMAHFSRLPVHRGRPDDVVGVINVFDVLTEDDARPVREHVREVLRLHASDTVPYALRRLQKRREVMAIVCDRRGRCVGLLTIKDLVEEITGDLEAW